MPQINTGRENTNARPPRTKLKKTRKVNVRPPDRADQRADVRKKQLARSKPKAGDAPQLRVRDYRRGQAYVKQQYADEAKGGTVRANRRGDVVKYRPGTTVPPDVAQSAVIRKGEARVSRQRAANLAPALVVLEQTSRPIHGVAAGTRAAIKGKNPLPAVGRGLALKDKSLFSDVLGDLGVKGPAKGIGGFALDVLADPTTYVSFGTASAARKAAEGEARKATAKALKAGATKKVADKAGRAAARKVLSTESNRGLTAGLAGKTTSGRTTAKIARAARVPQATEKLRGALPGRLVRHVAPSVRPGGVAEKDFLHVRDAMVRGRAVAATGEKRVRNRAQAIARVLPGDSHPRITDALENLGKPRQTREEFIAGAPKAARGTPEPTVEHLSQGLQAKGKPGIRPERVHMIETGRGGVQVGLGKPVDGLAAIVARDADGKAVGVLRMTVNEKGKPQILEVAVDPAQRGRGIGTALYDVAEKAGLDVKSATGRGGYTDAGAALAHKRAARGLGDQLAHLTDSERKVVVALRHDYDQMYRAEHARGLVGRKFREFGYSPRRAVSELEPTGSRRRLGGAQLESSKARTNRKPYAEFRGTADDIYTENAPLSYYLRGRDSYVKQGRKEVIDALHDVGRRWHDGENLKDGEEIFKFTGPKMPTKVEGDELKSLLRGGAPPGLNEYRILHRDLVKTAEQGIPERLGGLEELGRIWDRQIQGRVKTILTVINPQYHATNLYGDLFNAYKAAPVAALARDLGISVRALAYRARREAASKTLAKQLEPSSGSVKIGGHKVGLDDLIKEAEDHGAINQGFIGRDLAEVLDRQGKEAAQRLGQGRVASKTRIGRKIATSRVGSKISHPIDTVRDASQYREDAVRLALYLGRRRKGDGPDEAARFTNRHLFDYGDLTQFEKSVLRRVLPFYTFTARNFPQQVRALIERPGKYANLEKAREEALKASDIPEGYEGDLQKYEQQGLPVPIPGTSKLLYPKLPATDLSRLTLKDQGNYLMAMLTPLIKTPVELDQNYSFFLRKKIDDLVGEVGPDGEKVEQLKPAPPAILAALRKAPGGKAIMGALHMRGYTDQKTGKKVIGWPARVDYVWRSTPATAFASSAGSQIPNSRGQSPAQATFGYATGLKVVPFSKPDVAKNRAGDRYSYLEAKAKSMRREGTAYNKNGTRTGAYTAVLDEAREVYKLIDTSRPKTASGVSPEEAAKLLRGVSAGGGTVVDEAEVQKLLRGVGAGG